MHRFLIAMALLAIEQLGAASAHAGPNCPRAVTDTQPSGNNLAPVALTPTKDELRGLREMVCTLQAEREQFQRKTLELERQLVRANAQQKQLAQRNAELVQQIVRMQTVMTRLPRCGLFESEQQRANLVGVITGCRSGFCELSLGSDDGLREGDQLEVSFKGAYKGRVVVRKVAPDRSIAEGIGRRRVTPMFKGYTVRSRPLKRDKEH